ncbi:shikimate dehydrogenase [Ornithinimicrobium pekingense]|uniref:Shikimate-5-dehydrogenase (AroE) n=1 Tax=Ornithinimicrobium pekingense TaxID=384677 RepID=A0ABQ2FCI1_9MICO|nr:shikimate dehydrogenase [Ornithinimicrobium pekingense]GGK74139.1 putative shikimate-5-dehydrogenase (AroE) [Ornithinimicrobium pekingense]
MLSAAPHRARRAGVVGSPVAHSLSPVLHRAAYDALGLTWWSFEATQVAPGGLRGHVEQLPDDWAGLAVTMPLKEEALAVGTRVGAAAALSGAANTLVRAGSGWLADNTDVHGVVQALVEAGLQQPRRAVVLGGGATARSTLVALHEMGAREVTFVVREGLRGRTAELAARLGTDVRVLPLHGTRLVLDAAVADVVVSTLPPGADPCALVVPDGASAPVVMDVVYRPWPSRFAAAVGAASAGRVPVVRGTDMLLHQAVRQVELLTGHNGPVRAMRAALETEGAETA